MTDDEMMDTVEPAGGWDDHETHLRLYEAQRRQWMADVRVLGWWCPRCDVFAPPLPATWRGPGTGTVGWCMFCGMDPTVEGPPRPPNTEMLGLAGLIG